MSIVTLADLKQHLNITSSTNDDELADILDAAEEVVGGEVRALGVQSYTESAEVIGDAVILSHSPVVSVTSVSAPGQTITGWSFTQYGAHGGLTGLRGWRYVTVTYTAGYATLPASLRLAVLIIAAHLWETQRGPAPVGPLAASEDFATPGLGFAIPNRARELLAPYVRSAIA